MDDAVIALLDRVRGTHHGTGRLFAMPADVGSCRGRCLPVDEVKIDHRLAAMGFTFRTGFDARLAADAARRIDVEFVAVHQALPFFGSDMFPFPLDVRAQSGGSSAFLSWHADTLNSGILLRGSSVRCVSRFALLLPAQ